MKDCKPKTEISLYFHDQSISEVFCELLASLGLQSSTLSSIEELKYASRIITEPLYYDLLNSDQQKRCLLIGNPSTSRDLECPVIRQPLTPDKVEAGLSSFLSQPLQGG